MNISLSKKITLSIFAAFLSSLINTSSALALTWSISGTFNDGGNLSGTFDFDEATDIYSKTSINTTNGSTLSGTTYTNDSLLFGGNSSGFGFDDDSGNVLLTINFISNLSSTSGAISFDTITNPTIEEDFAETKSRSLLSGTATPVAVPFEPSTNLAIFAVLGLAGLNYYRKKLN